MRAAPRVLLPRFGIHHPGLLGYSAALSFGLQSVMNPLEQQLLKETAGDAVPRLTLRTRTWIDTGCWWRSSPLWLCIMPGEIILLAIGRRRHCERVPLARCHASHYNAASGELVIAPADNLRFPRLAMTPAEALHILKSILSPTPNPTTEPANQC